MTARAKRDVRRHRILGVFVFLLPWEISARVIDNALTRPP